MNGGARAPVPMYPMAPMAPMAAGFPTISQKANDGLCMNCYGPCGGNTEACGTDETPDAAVQAYVGPGGGAWVQETSYRYVGNGAGDYALPEQLPASEPMNANRRCIIMVVIATAIPLLVLLYIFVSNLGKDQTSETLPSYSASSLAPTIPSQAPQSLAGFDCDSMDSAQVWTLPKKEYCCRNFGKGCIPTAAPTAAPAPNCRVGAPASWAMGKKVYCCLHHHINCPSTKPPTTTTVSYSCSRDFEHWETHWSIGKKIFCCKHMGRGCPPTAHPTESPDAGSPA